MSCDGTAMGAPCAGDRMLFDESMSVEASICASGESGMWTAIWSPSKSALKAVQTSGWSLMRLAFHQHGLKGLDAETVKRGGAVEQDRMVADDLFEDVPNDRVLLFDQFLRLLDGGAVAALFQAVIDERLEEFKRHLLRQTALAGA